MTNKVDLLARITLMSGMVESMDVRTRKYTALKLVEDMTFTNIVPGVKYDALDTMILRLPNPPIILLEKPAGNMYEVLAGHSILETMVDVVINPDNFEPYYLVRRIKEYEAHVIIFRCNMNREAVLFLVNKVYGINITENQ